MTRKHPAIIPIVTWLVLFVHARVQFPYFQTLRGVLFLCCNAVSNCYLSASSSNNGIGRLHWRAYVFLRQSGWLQAILNQKHCWYKQTNITFYRRLILGRTYHQCEYWYAENHHLGSRLAINEFIHQCEYIINEQYCPKPLRIAEYTFSVWSDEATCFLIARIHLYLHANRCVCS